MYGGVPPETFAVKVVISPRSTVVGEAEQVTNRGSPETTRLKIVGPLALAGEPVTVMG